MPETHPEYGTSAHSHDAAIEYWESHVHFEIPYNLKNHEIVLDPATRARNPRLDENLKNLYDRYTHDQMGNPASDALERIFLATVMLSKPGIYSFAECLDTAMIWEFG